MARINDFMTKIDLSELREYIMRNGTTVQHRRGSDLCRKGEVCRNVGIVISGYFKYTAIASDGEECVTGFSFKDEIVTDYVCSFLFNRPSFTSITAGADATVLQVPISAIREHLKEHHPGFVAETSSVLLREAYSRYIDLHTLTPEERYNELCKRDKCDLREVALQEIASFLTISRRQLHRIRNGR